ncbi:MAG: hypothetical protein IKW99_03470 [Bacteroidales bacterium]|nr:hypothetical protein [Bacteroidales bacterium]
MIHRELMIGRWHVYFIFAPDGYDDNTILDLMYDLDAPDYILVKAGKKMRRNRPNEGFTYSNEETREAVVVIGHTTSGKEFVNTLVHEIKHLSVAIADSLGLDMRGEAPAYIAGDSAEELAGIICELGCDKCNKED